MYISETVGLFILIGSWVLAALYVIKYLGGDDLYTKCNHPRSQIKADAYPAKGGGVMVNYFYCGDCGKQLAAE
jgi:hypothetical protein